MTEPGRVAQVRARLAEVKALCEEDRQLVGIAQGYWPFTVDEVLRLVAHAEDVLNLHRKDGDYCWTCDHTSWPCDDYEAVIKAWTP